MSCIRVLPSSLLTILLIFSLTFVVALSSREEESHFLTFQTVHSSGLFDEHDHRLVGSWGKRRFLDEDLSASDEPPLNSSLILAAKRTNRKDPLNDFKKYNGGWNISNKHYWASVAYTAVPFFLVAGIWFVVFGLCLLIMVFYFCCCRKEPYGYSRVAYALSLILLILFTVIAIVGCIILYLGQGKFYNSTTDTLEYVVDQANTTSETLRNVSGYLAAAKDVKVLQVILPANVQGDIDQVQAKIDSASTTLSDKALDNAKDIKDLINSVRLALIILAAVMLFVTFLGFVFSIFGMQFLVYVLVVSGWILVTGTFILCGIFLLLHNVTGDTCVSMDQWVRNPTAHTSLDDILPCVDNATAQDTLTKSREVTSQLVDVVNQVITNVSNINFSPNFAPMYYNQSGPLLPLLCNPFYPDLTNRTCTPGEVDLNNATQVWSNYVCQVSPNGICLTTGRLTPEFYRQMSAGVNVSYGLYHFGPYLASLQDCSYVRQTFTEIHSNYCPGLETYTKLVYIGLVMVASAVMLSLLFWVIYGRERRHRVYTKEHMPTTRSSADIYEGDKS